MGHSPIGPPIRRFIMKKRMILDTAMLVTFLLLLDYGLVHNRGHEILGILFLLLALLHTKWNLSWYRSLQRGRWTKQRVFSFLTNGVLILSFLTVMVTGLSISRTVFPFHPHLSFWVNGLHQAAGYLMLIALGLHLGLHWQAILPRMQRRLSLDSSRVLSWVNKLLMILIVSLGIYFSFDAHVGNRLLLLSARSSSSFHNPGWFLFSRLMMIGLYASLAYYGQKLLSRK